MCFNYHAKIKKLISENHLIDYQFVKKYNKISPALVLFFDCHKPMPVRVHKWQEYKLFLKHFNIDLKTPQELKNDKN